MQRFSKPLYRTLTTLPVRQRGMLIISIPLVCLFTSLATFAGLRASMVANDSDVQEAQRVQIETKQLLTALLDAEDNMQAFGLTRRPEFLHSYQNSLATITESLADLKPLVQDNPQQQRKLNQIRKHIDQSVNLLDQKITIQQNLKKTSGREELVVPTTLLYDWLEEGESTLDATYDQIDLFAQEEERFLEERERRQELYRQMTWNMLCLMAVVGSGAGLLSICLFRQLEHELAAQQIDLQQTNQKLERACDQLQRFTANASHELRTPLAAVLSNAQVGLMEPEDASALRKKLEKIVGLTKSMGGLVNDLLFLSRQEGSLTHECLQSTNLVLLLKPLVNEWIAQAEAYQIQLSSQFPSIPVVVNAEPILLKQAIINLLSNACYYTHPGGRIQLRLLTKANQALIEVEDSGIGISAEDLPYIFEQFYRVDKSRNRIDGRFGLGLAIVQQVIQAHNGSITVTSTVKQGSVFQIVLPLVSASKSD